MLADEHLHRHAAENLEQADALLFGRVTYETMAAARAHRSDASFDGTLRPDDRRGTEARHIEHPGPGVYRVAGARR